ncbi:hypothetical protein BDN70DRAFT_516680 [Pholiota conissans]|uniref:Secreted protein n=1 Tax=Pholiota conissans TaxID=109636 RepID=A0A9P5YQQ7_9AGAR|nr:hypothetical protein BDN70DRAFT_516680 [Pholiota conissans]
MNSILLGSTTLRFLVIVLRGSDSERIHRTCDVFFCLSSNPFLLVKSSTRHPHTLIAIVTLAPTRPPSSYSRVESPPLSAHR